MVLAATRPIDGTFRVGTDIVDLARFRAHVLRHGAPFLARLFTREEIDAAERWAVDIVAALGTALAVKKAVLAAIRPTAAVPLTDIVVGWGHGEWGSVALHGECGRAAIAQDVTLADMACARSGQVATATVIVRTSLVTGALDRATPYDSAAIGHN